MEKSPQVDLKVVLGLRNALAEYCQSAKEFMALCLRDARVDSSLHLALNDPVYQEVYTTSWQHLLAGVDHLDALVETLHGEADTVRVPQTACFSLSRGCLESASYACWLLELDVPKDVQLARGLAARVHNASEGYKLQKEAARRRDLQVIETRAQVTISSIERSAREHNLVVSYDGRWPVKFGTQSRPEATYITARWLKRLYRREKHPLPAG
jgi:hypothetical protein